MFQKSLLPVDSIAKSNDVADIKVASTQGGSKMNRCQWK